MLDKPKITQTQAQTTAIIRMTIPREQIQTVMGPGFQELMTTVAAQGLKPTGPFYSHHLRMDPKVFDFEIGVPVSAPVRASGRVQSGQLPAAKVARTVYHGPYEGLGPAWGEFNAWVQAEGLTPSQDLWEVYAAGPESSPNPEDWCTELNRPIKP